MPIALMTDFGSSSPYVGIMKGVISKIAPEAQVIDLSHSIPPYRIVSGAFCLEQSYPYFPDGTIFVVVVDPGVGTPRKAILARANHHYFIAPDNGVLSLVLHEAKEVSLFHLNQSEYHLSKVSETFHGRDIFAPVAAHLHQGVDLLDLGEVIQDYEIASECFPKKSGDRLEGQIIHIDPFGNAITNIHRKDCQEHFQGQEFTLHLPHRRRPPLRQIYQYYGQTPAGEILILFGSSDFLEIAQNQGNAAQAWKLHIGQRLYLQASEAPSFSSGEINLAKVSQQG